MGERRSIQSVLVVDDDDKMLRAFKRVSGDRTILTTNDAATATELAKSERPDLVIIDLRLGTNATSGLELVKRVRADLPDARIVLCSGYLSVAATVTAVRAGAEMVVFKPITLAEILTRLEEDEEELDLGETPTLARAEWEHIMRVLADCDGNVSMAARRLGIYRSSLQRKLRKYAPQS